MLPSFMLEWCREYDVPLDITVLPDNPPHLPVHVLGQTWCREHDQVRYAVIDVQQCIPTDSLTYEALLWHEFCHAESWLKDGRRDGHDAAWKARLHRKWFLAFWDTWINPFTYPWYRHNLRRKPFTINPDHVRYTYGKRCDIQNERLLSGGARRFDSYDVHQPRA